MAPYQHPTPTSKHIGQEQSWERTACPPNPWVTGIVDTKSCHRNMHPKHWPSMDYFFGCLKYWDYCHLLQPDPPRLANRKTSDIHSGQIALKFAIDRLRSQQCVSRGNITGTDVRNDRRTSWNASPGNCVCGAYPSSRASTDSSNTVSIQ